MTHQPNLQLGRLIVVVSRSHTHTHTHTEYDSSERVISSSQRPLPTQHTTNRREENACPQRYSNPWPQKSRGCITARPPKSAQSIILFSHNPANVLSAGNWAKFGRTFNISSTLFPIVCCDSHLLEQCYRLHLCAASPLRSQPYYRQHFQSFGLCNSVYIYGQRSQDSGHSIR